MNKSIKFSFFAILLIGLFMATSCAPSGGAGVVSEMCEIIDKASKELEKCNSPEDLQNMNYVKALQDKNMDKKIEEYKDYELTDADKEKLKKSFNGFITTFMNKLSLVIPEAAGMTENMDSGIKMMTSLIDQKIDSATTLGSLEQAIGSGL